MKAFLLSALLLISTPLMALDACFTGSWYDPARNGEGIALEVSNKHTLGYFYTYGSEGRAWYVMLSDNSTNVMTMYGTIKLSETPFSVLEAEVGKATVTEVDFNTLEFSYDMSLDVDSPEATPWCLSGFCEAAYVYKRLTQPIPCE